MPHGPWYEIPARAEVDARVNARLHATSGAIDDVLVPGHARPATVDDHVIHQCRMQPAQVWQRSGPTDD